MDLGYNWLSLVGTSGQDAISAIGVTLQGDTVELLHVALHGNELRSFLIICDESVTEDMGHSRFKTIFVLQEV